MLKDKLNELESIIKQKYQNICGIIINKDGNDVYEKYFHSCNSESYLHVYSVTKSIVSILYGIAMDKGYAIHLDQKVLDFFPDYSVKSPNQSIKDITLKNILTMTSPYKYGMFPPYIKYFTSYDWVKFSLDILGGKRDIGKFHYAPLIGPDILSGILMKVTNKSVLELANEYLFGPLDIKPKEQVIFQSKNDQISFNKSTNINAWVSDRSGTNSAGWGLTLSVQDMTKIGLLISNNGKYNSQEVVSESWIKNLTSIHSKWDKHNLSYGLLWWIIDENKKIYAAMGDGGNTIYINKSKKMIVSIHSLFSNKVKDRIKFIQTFIDNN